MELRNTRFLLGLLVLFVGAPRNEGTEPLVINTWNFLEANQKAWHVLAERGGSSLDAVVAGCSECERLQCDNTVGFGGSPDENGETTLDAMIMDGSSMNIGAVAGLRNVRDAIAVARHVMENTAHTLLVGESATEFAVQMGFKRESLATPNSTAIWSLWKQQRCQPNFWINVQPDPREHCGPYEPRSANDLPHGSAPDHGFGGFGNHDTIGMIVIDHDGNIAAGTSTNGARHKIPGRVGDSPIPGSGAYADNTVGAAAATGDGDILMRFLPSLLTVEFMRQNKTPSEAAGLALDRIRLHYPQFMGAIVAANKYGEYGAACHGIANFPYSIYSLERSESVVQTVSCTLN